MHSHHMHIPWYDDDDDDDKNSKYFWQEGWDTFATLWDEKYFYNKWNWVLLGAVISTLITVTFHLQRDQRCVNVGAIAGLLLWSHALYYMRGFALFGHEFGPLIRMMFQITADAVPFMVVLFIMTIAFANAFFLLFTTADKDFYRYDDGARMPFYNPINSFFMMWAIMFGDLPLDLLEWSSSENLALFLLFIYIVVVAIVLLNLLIAIMGETYAKVQEQAEAEGLREKAQLLVEMMDLLDENDLNNRMRSSTWLYQLSPEKGHQDSGGGWGGTVKAIERMLKEKVEGSLEEMKRDGQKKNREIQQLQVSSTSAPYKCQTNARQSYHYYETYDFVLLM